MTRSDGSARSASPQSMTRLGRAETLASHLIRRASRSRAPCGSAYTPTSSRPSASAASKPRRHEAAERRSLGWKDYGGSVPTSADTHHRLLDRNWTRWAAQPATRHRGRRNSVRQGIPDPAQRSRRAARDRRRHRRLERQFSSTRRTAAGRHRDEPLVSPSRRCLQATCFPIQGRGKLAVGYTSTICATISPAAPLRRGSAVDRLRFTRSAFRFRGTSEPLASHDAR